VERAGFEHPTSIQARLIPEILAGRDVLGQARTGTGKTAAFGLPLIHLIPEEAAMAALVLAPTRELAAQVASEIDVLAHFTPIRTACVVGGESMQHQERDLRQGAQVIVGTPGRVMDLHGRGLIDLGALRFAVLDEVDRMLDIGFRDDIRRILGAIRGEHQTIFVSATIDEEIERLGRSFMQKDARKIVSTSGALTVAQVDQCYISVENWYKRRMLEHLIKTEAPQTTLVFCRTKATVHRLTEHLNRRKLKAREIHGDMHQKSRNRVMEQMRRNEINVLVASDLAARGLDVEHITHVVNYDLPDDPEVYVHRIGRTARAGRSGVAWSFVNPDQGQLLTEIEKLAGVMIQEKKVPDFDPGEPPEEIRQEKEATARLQKKREDPTAALAERARPPGFEDYSEEELKKMFPPDGKVPAQAPRRTLGSKLRSRRG